MNDSEQHPDHDKFSPGERAILEDLGELRKEIRQMGSEEQVAFEALEQAVAGVEGDEHEAAAEFAALAEEIKGLKAGTITAAQINELAAKTTAVGQKLKADTAADQGI